MPNTQTSVPVFTTGQVLTAQQQTEINTGIPVFATTVTRDAAFGGTGEKTLAEGQFAYIEATNSTQYYDGASWQAVGVTPGLVCVKAETAFTTVSSVTLDSIFTSTYTNYKIVLRTSFSTAAGVGLQLRVGGVTSTAANYSTQRQQSDGTAYFGAKSTGQTSFTNLINSQGAFFGQTDLDLYSPFVATPTISMCNSQNNDANYTNPFFEILRGVHNVSTAFDGFIFTATAGTITGTYTVYGYSKAV